MRNGDADHSVDFSKQAKNATASRQIAITGEAHREIARVRDTLWDLDALTENSFSAAIIALCRKIGKNPAGFPAVKGKEHAGKLVATHITEPQARILHDMKDFFGYRSVDDLVGAMVGRMPTFSFSRNWKPYPDDFDFSLWIVRIPVRPKLKPGREWSTSVVWLSDEVRRLLRMEAKDHGQRAYHEGLSHLLRLLPPAPTGAAYEAWINRRTDRERRAMDLPPIQR